MFLKKTLDMEWTDIDPLSTDANFSITFIIGGGCFPPPSPEPSERDSSYLHSVQIQAHRRSRDSQTLHADNLASDSPHSLRNTCRRYLDTKPNARCRHVCLWCGRAVQELPRISMLKRVLSATGDIAYPHLDWTL
ncbi:hypothetical protein TNCV_4404141 [Trichonephila clavipes]|uniref:Uncharacterized protein n=1 Tax=Trichonephila clavipes TaxID=2585209 RepID=A0A8X6S1G6_TRICX|nr:hypothetical protein TNCV_4404141 [Trichonephila clavipes]